MPDAREFRRQARAALSGNWPVAMAVTFVALLLGAGISGNIRLPDFVYETKLFDNDIIGPWVTLWSKGIISYLLQPLTGWLMLYGVWLAIALLLFCIVIGGAAQVGLCRYHTLLVAGREQRPFATLFAPFSYLGRAAALCFFSTLFVLLWLLLFIIPGVIAAYRYAMAPYILAHEPGTGALEALERSKRMMAGHKLQLFWLHLTFIGWRILSALTLGLAGLWVSPYQCAAEAAFYLQLAEPFKEEEWVSA